MDKIIEELKPIEVLLHGNKYAELEKLMAEINLERLERFWPRFKPLEKLVLFKLLDAPRAMDFYGLLPFREKYYLLCGFPLNTIAPILESLKPSQRRLFVQLPRKFYDRMFRQLVSERVEITLSLRNN